MKKITLIMLLAFAAVCTVSCSSGQKSKAEGKPQSSAESSKPDEGEAAALKTEKWKSGKDNSDVGKSYLYPISGSGSVNHGYVAGSSSRLCE